MKRISLKIKRIERNLSQKELATIVGISNQSISDYENGRLNPSYEIMGKISKELKTSVDELFFNENKKY